MPALWSSWCSFSLGKREFCWPLFETMPSMCRLNLVSLCSVFSNSKYLVDVSAWRVWPWSTHCCCLTLHCCCITLRLVVLARTLHLSGWELMSHSLSPPTAPAFKDLPAEFCGCPLSLWGGRGWCRRRRDRPEKWPCWPSRWCTQGIGPKGLGLNPVVHLILRHGDELWLCALDDDCLSSLMQKAGDPISQWFSPTLYLVYRHKFPVSSCSICTCWLSSFLLVYKL